MSVKPESPFEQSLYRAAERRAAREAEQNASEAYWADRFERLYLNGVISANTVRENEGMGTMRVTSETKAELTCKTGRVIGLLKGSEPDTISLAVPADRAVMTADEALALAAWLAENAKVINDRTRSVLGTGQRIPGRGGW